jgi:transposase
MLSIVRRDSGETHDEFLCGLAKGSGIDTPTREDLVRLDRKHNKRTSRNVRVRRTGTRGLRR